MGGYFNRVSYENVVFGVFGYWWCGWYWWFMFENIVVRGWWWWLCGIFFDDGFVGVLESVCDFVVFESFLNGGEGCFGYLFDVVLIC